MHTAFGGTTSYTRPLATIDTAVMIKYTLIFLFAILTGFINVAECQIIQGRVISRFPSNLEGLPGTTISINNTYQVSDIDGFFIFDSLMHYPDSIIIDGYIHARLVINNLPKNYDTLNLGSLELIEHRIISADQYDSLKKEMTINIGSNSSQDVNIFMKDNYRELHDWNHLLGYLDLRNIVSLEMANPFDNNDSLSINFDKKGHRITLDFSKIKKSTVANKW